MHQLGVLQPVVELLGHASPRVRARAARCVRAAAANNAPFQKTLLEQHPDALTSLMTLLAGADEQPAAAALAALGAVLRNSAAARGAFYLGAGLPHLQLLLRDGQRPLGMRRTALGLLTDLLQEDTEVLAAAMVKGTAAGLDAPAAVHAALQLLAHPEADRDIQEKALLLLQLLLEREPEAPGLLSEAGAATQLAELQAELQATIAAARGSSSRRIDNGDGGGGYLQELAALVAAVQRSMAGRDGVQLVHTEL